MEASLTRNDCKVTFYLRFWYGCWRYYFLYSRNTLSVRFYNRDAEKYLQDEACVSTTQFALLFQTYSHSLVLTYALLLLLLGISSGSGCPLVSGNANATAVALIIAKIAKMT